MSLLAGRDFSLWKCSLCKRKSEIQVNILLRYPTLTLSNLGKLDYVSRKIPRFALATNTAHPALILCRRPW